MRGRIIQKILSNLENKEFSEFLVFTQNSVNHEKLEAISIFLKKEQYSEDGVLAILNVGKRKKNLLLDELGRAVVDFIGSNGSDFSIEAGLEVGRRLALSMEGEAAIVVIKPAIEHARKFEKLEFLIRAHSVLNMLNGKADIEKINIESACNRLIVNTQLRCLLADLVSQRTSIPKDQYKALLLSARLESLSIFDSGKLGQRGTYGLLKVQAHIDRNLKDTKFWIQSTEALVSHIEATPWVCDDFELELASEKRTLAQLYWQAKDYSKFRILSKGFSKLKFKSRRAQFEQVLHQYPFLIGVAIESGDEKLGLTSISNLKRLIEIGMFDSAPQFLTLNIYVASYFLLNAGRIDEAYQSIQRLERHNRGSFSPHLLPISDLLRSLCLIEKREFEDAIRVLRNLGKSSRRKLIEGVDVAITLLLAYIKTIESNQLDELSAQLKLKSLASGLNNSILSNYLDLDLWLESKKMNRPMLTISKHQAVLENRFQY